MSAALPPAVFARHERIQHTPGIVGKVSAGLVAVVRATTGDQRAVLQIYRPGHVIGARALLSVASDHGTHLEALVPTSVEWLAVTSTPNTAITRAVLGVTAARARYQEYAVWRRREQTVQQRVAQLLAGLANDPIHGTAGGTSHRLLRADAAALVGATKSTTGEIYRQFARRGWITVAGHSLAEIDVDQLRQYASRDVGPAAYPDLPLLESQEKLWHLLAAL